MIANLNNAYIKYNEIIKNLTEGLKVRSFYGQPWALLMYSRVLHSFIMILPFICKSFRIPAKNGPMLDAKILTP